MNVAEIEIYYQTDKKWTGRKWVTKVTTTTTLNKREKKLEQMGDGHIVENMYFDGILDNSQTPHHLLLYTMANDVMRVISIPLTADWRLPCYFRLLYMTNM